jgi:hypothetical protein
VLDDERASGPHALAHTGDDAADCVETVTPRGERQGGLEAHVAFGEVGFWLAT